MISALKIFSHCTCYYTITFTYAVSRMVMQPFFQSKICFYGTNNIHILRTKQHYTKLLNNFESTIKYTSCYLRHFSKFCLCRKLFVGKIFCMKTGLYNSFETANAVILTKASLQSSYKILQIS